VFVVYSCIVIVLINSGSSGCSLVKTISLLISKLFAPTRIATLKRSEAATADKVTICVNHDSCSMASPSATS
jgi:hypothetical protein